MKSLVYFSEFLYRQNRYLQKQQSHTHIFARYAYNSGESITEKNKTRQERILPEQVERSLKLCMVFRYCCCCCMRFAKGTYLAANQTNCIE